MQPAPGPERVIAVDVARGLAVLGMFTAHILPAGELLWDEPATWRHLVDGRSAILFVLLAGFSLGVIAGRPVPKQGEALAAARVRVLARAVLIALIGGILIALPTQVAGILLSYALLFVLALPFLGWRARDLLMLAAAIALLGPVVVAALRAAVTSSALWQTALLDLLIGPYYPVLIWAAFLLAGLGIARLDLGRLRVQLGLLAVAVPVSALGYLGPVLLPLGLGPAAGYGPDTDEAGTGVVAPLETWLLAFAGDPVLADTAAPHSSTTWEVLGSGGFAVALLALLLLAGSRLRQVLYPVWALGTMPLTAYSLHVVAFAVLGWTGLYSWFDPGGEPLLVLLCFFGAALVAAPLWVALLGRGPLERSITWLSERIVAAPARHRARLD